LNVNTATNLAVPVQADDDRYRVMVVDDSVVIRGLLARALEGDPRIRVVASVGNGQLALSTLDRQDIEVVVLDIEMPVMDGMTALPKLIAAKPNLQVIMASTLTLQNAGISMRAMAAGAVDYIPKPSSRELSGAKDFNRDLIEKVKAWGGAARRARGLREPRGGAVAVKAPRPITGAATAIRLRMASVTRPDAVAIGSSTGGPQALAKLVAGIGAWMKLPVFITQHMPPTFTTILAEHLANAAGMPAAEGRNGEPVVGGRIYVAPGSFHMTVVIEGGQKIIRLLTTPPENFCRPAVDPMLRSLVSVYGARLTVVMLTGMGQDGLKGSEAVIAGGGGLMAQDEATSVVWGMPGAVAMAGLCSAVLPLAELAPRLKRIVLGI
jgi:two-component system chemotaxis response regulator CheB